jgi:hypothetical protein
LQVTHWVGEPEHVRQLELQVEHTKLVALLRNLPSGQKHTPFGGERPFVQVMH